MLSMIFITYTESRTCIIMYTSTVLVCAMSWNELHPRRAFQVLLHAPHGLLRFLRSSDPHWPSPCCKPLLVGAGKKKHRSYFAYQKAPSNAWGEHSGIGNVMLIQTYANKQQICSFQRNCWWPKRSPNLVKHHRHWNSFAFLFAQHAFNGTLKVLHPSFLKRSLPDRGLNSEMWSRLAGWTGNWYTYTNGIMQWIRNGLTSLHWFPWLAELQYVLPNCLR